MKSSALKTQNRVLVGNCRIARSFFSRFMGLMGRKSLPADEAILFPKCNSVHTMFMRFPIDVVLVDAQGRVVGVDVAMKPWRMMMPRKNTKHIIELPANRSEELGIRAGVLLDINGVWS
jgi:uncharacterized membrane protein (UPF0127 family)